MERHTKEIKSKLSELKEWKLSGKSITKDYDFPDFRSALAFVDNVGDLAEEANHHPQILLAYGKVHIELSSHDQGGITDKDFALAQQIDQLIS